MLSKPLMLVIAVLFSGMCFFGYLSYSFYGDRSTLKADVNRLAKANATLVSDVEKATKSCLIVDEINRKYNEEQKALDEKKEGIVKQIDSIPKKSHTTTKESSDVEETNVVDIDGVLPLDLQRMLNEAFLGAKRKP
jgi:hypothetical protein